MLFDRSNKASQPASSNVPTNETGFKLDDFTKLLAQDDARQLVDLLKLAVAGRCNDGGSREALAEVLSALGTASPTTKDMILELCVTEVSLCTVASHRCSFVSVQIDMLRLTFQLEDVATDTERLRAIPQPVIQESSHPYTRKSHSST